MIRSLIRANSNGKGVFLTISHDEDLKPIFIKKSSSSVESILNLKNEVKGAEWYARISKKNLIRKTTSLPDYFSVDFNYISGKKTDYRDGYLSNLNYIEKAIKLYCEVWSEFNNEEASIHGDFSLDNIIFNDDGKFLIDWEHFSDSKKIPLGFDALNLIFEQLYFMNPVRRLNNKTIKHVESMFQFLVEAKCLNKIYWINPLSTMHEFVINNESIWGEQIDKLPIMMFTKKEIEEIDKKICMKKE